MIRMKSKQDLDTVSKEFMVCGHCGKKINSPNTARTCKKCNRIIGFRCRLFHKIWHKIQSNREDAQ